MSTTRISEILMLNWIVVEGTDFSGKSTLCKSINDLLVSFGKTSEVYQHPGALSTGKELRAIIKSTSDLDWLTEQLIPCADYTNFVANMPRLSANTINNIISDRISLITGPAFALSKNPDITQITSLFQTIRELTEPVIKSQEVKTTLVLLDTPPDRIIEERIQNRRTTVTPVDHFDTRKQIRRIYKTLFAVVARTLTTTTLNPDDTHNESFNIPDSSPEVELVNRVILPSIKSVFARIVLVKQPFDILKNARKIIDTL